MGQVLHGSATTTEAVRRAIQHRQASLRALAKRYGINRKTVAKWKKRTSVADVPTGPREPRSTVLSVEDEAVIVAFRGHRLLAPDDCLHALQPMVRQVAATGSRHLPNASFAVIARIGACSDTGSAGFPMWTAIGPQRRSSRAAPSAFFAARTFGSHRHCRGADRGRQALSLRGH